MEHRIGKATFNDRVRSFVLGNPLKCELEACAGGVQGPSNLLI